MRKIQRILVIMEPGSMRQAALERALAIWRALSPRTKVSITAMMPVDDSSWDLSNLLTIDKEKFRRNLLAKQERWLKGYLNINAMGVDIASNVVWSKNVSYTIVDEAMHEGADLIIKAADEHGMISKVIFTPLDLQLLRYAPVPVLIAKDHIWQTSNTIAVAVDMRDPKDPAIRSLNMRMLREAQELARVWHSSIHLLNAIAPMVPPASLDLPGYTPDLLGDEALKEGCRNVLAFAARHNIPSDHCHIREGMPDEVIPAICAELKPSLLLIGTSARTGLAQALLGNICERVIDALDCDVAVITPKAVKERLPEATVIKK